MSVTNLTLGQQIISAKKELEKELLPVVQRWEAQTGLRLDQLRIARIQIIGQVPHAFQVIAVLESEL